MILPNRALWGQAILLPFLFVTIFLLPFLPIAWQSIAYRLSSTAIILAVLVITNRIRILMPLILATILAKWTGRLWLASPLLENLAEFVQLFIFLYGVGLLIARIARRKTVNLTTIVEGINGFLLLGFTYALLVTLFQTYQPQAFSFQENDLPLIGQSIYFTFVTITTLGYGELVPLSPQAGALATLIAVSGQLYLTVLLALLVGKYSNRI